MISKNFIFGVNIFLLITMRLHYSSDAADVVGFVQFYLPHVNDS